MERVQPKLHIVRREHFYLPNFYPLFLRGVYSSALVSLSYWPMLSAGTTEDYTTMQDYKINLKI